MFFSKKQPPVTRPEHVHGLETIIADLRHSIAWMDEVFAHISESICVIAQDGTIRFANDAFAEVVKEERILLLGQPVWKYMYLAANDGKVLNATTLSKAWSPETASGLNGQYVFNKQPVELKTQYVIGVDQMILVIRPVSDAEISGQNAKELLEHLQAEQTRMQELAAKDEAMLRSIGDAVIAADKDGNLVLMNQSAEKLFGLDGSKLFGKRVIDFLAFYDDKGQQVPPEDRLITRALHTGELQSNVEGARSFYRKLDGTQLSIAITITPIRLKDEIIGAIGIYRDVTHAQEVDRMKTEFISLASHQLRTPLSAIKWFSEMLLSGDAGDLNEDQQDFAKNISQSTDRMIQLVNSLLNISRLESGRIIVDPKPTDLKELVTSVLNDLRGLIEEKKQTLVVSVHDNLGKVMLDQRLVGQAYLNLLTNAVRYTPAEGEITVIISADGNNIVSQVSDNGLGIPVAQQQKLFQKFFRAENAVKVETDGNGLGLYLVRAIVESSGGKVWFKSEEGKGSTFWFSIPKTGMKARQGEVMLETAHKENEKI